MKSSLFSAVEFLIVVVVFASGGFLITLPWTPVVRFKLAAFFAEQEGFFLLLGAVIILMGFVLLFGFYWMNRKRFFQVVMKVPEKRVEVEEELVLASLSIYWKGLFPEEELMTNVLIHRDQKIELIAEIPKLEEEAQKVLLEKVEKEVGVLLARQLGYEREFFLTVVMK